MSTLIDVPSRLIGRAELMLLLGVSRTRAVVLSDADDFPAPVGRLIMGNVWELDAVRAWADKRGRTLDFDALTPEVKASDDSDPQSKREP